MRAVTERKQTEAPRKVGAQERKDSACKPGRSVGDGRTDLLPWHGRGGPEEKGGNSSREGGERIVSSALPGSVGQSGAGAGRFLACLLHLQRASLVGNPGQSHMGR